MDRGVGRARYLVARIDRLDFEVAAQSAARDLGSSKSVIHEFALLSHVIGVGPDRAR